jgi:signal transduction histidine kinase
MTELERASASLRFLAGASEQLSESLDYDMTLSRVTRLAVPQLADWCTVDLLDDDGRIHRVAAAHADPTKEALLHETLQRYPLQLDEPRGVAIALRTGQTLIQPELTEAELRTAARDERHLQILQELRPRSHLIVPLISHGKRLGALSLLYADDSGRRYTDSDRALAEDLARRCAQAVENAQLYRAASEAEGQVRALNAELEQRVAERERLLVSEQAALAELRETQLRVIQQERLRALGQMASGIAHDFNNALSPIVAYTDLLLMEPEKLADRDRVTSFLEMMQTAAADATEVVRRLRDFYRQREGDEVTEPVHVDDLVAQVISLTQFRWKDQAQARGANITFKTDVQHLPPVAGNAADLREALTNLVFNAVDAMPDGGTITITMRVDDEAVRLGVWDTGLGMTEEVRLRCLEPFFTTKGEHGTGLGLGLVYGIVQRHLGALEIESAPGAGTTVWIRLPIWNPDASVAKRPAALDPVRPLRVLVVEDEPLIRTALIEYLSLDGHTVETATNGRAGLAQFRAGTFDLVLTDRALPEMSGDHLAAAIKQLSPAMPVIMVTGFGDLMTQHGERPAGIDLVVSKPVTITALRNAIAQVATR